MEANESSFGVSPPSPGTVWQGLYEVLEILPDSSAGPSWRARIIGSPSTVVIRQGRSLDPARVKAWELLQALTHRGIQRAVARHLVGERAYEVYEAPPPSTLQSWRAASGSPSENQIVALVKSFVPALAALHRAGLVHLNLRPDSVCLIEEEGSLGVRIIGLEAVTLFAREELIPASVDPFYAPPEAAGLFRHSPGFGMLAWDWWSLGRILQELVLGRPVLGLILDRDVSRVTPEIRERAEMLLLERMSGDIKPGGVDEMKGLPPRIQLLLHGLLSASRDARWRDIESAAWCAGESPREHYALPSKERCFRYAGQAFTVPEASELFRDAAL